ncbi:hypothetical protein [Desulfosporosinus sp. BG]|uniref:hypothetical protein n=1 Tax=Desulfosporosinus sp. BG TaxID=1633135 RepID=UPI001FA75642|nr:hypothetical protein [Desulfosporosinus sp. BG]
MVARRLCQYRKLPYGDVAFTASLLHAFPLQSTKSYRTVQHNSRCQWTCRVSRNSRRRGQPF